MNSFLALSLLLSSAILASATFNLNTQGPDWDYPAADLANTTSQACKDAYSAPIDCDGTLLGVVASMRPAFSPDASDFDRTCTSTCNASLTTYMKNIKSACSAPGDLAQQSAVKPGGGYTWAPAGPVSIVAAIFQYTFARACVKDTDNTYCELNEGSQSDSLHGYTSESDFDCRNSCQIQFYTNAHAFNSSGGSSWQFNYYALVPIGDWWMENFAEGWKTVRQCEGRNNTASTSVSGDATATTVTESVSAARSTIPPSSSVTSTTTTSTAGAAAATTSHASSASRMRSVLHGMPLWIF